MIDDARLSMDYLKDNGIVSQSETFQGSRIKANNIKLFTHIENIFSGIIDQKELEIELQNKQRENELLLAESIENDMDEVVGSKHICTYRPRSIAHCVKEIGRR